MIWSSLVVLQSHPGMAIPPSGIHFGSSLAEHQINASHPRRLGSGSFFIFLFFFHYFLVRKSTYAGSAWSWDAGVVNLARDITCWLQTKLFEAATRCHCTTISLGKPLATDVTRSFLCLPGLSSYCFRLWWLAWELADGSRHKNVKVKSQFFIQNNQATNPKEEGESLRIAVYMLQELYLKL